MIKRMVIWTRQYKGRQDGQSVLEFLFMLPLLIGLTLLMIRFNTAIQISIVDQQYARAQTLFTAANHANYPSLSKQGRLLLTDTNQLVVGVSDNAAPNADEEQVYIPKASTQWIARGKERKDNSAAHEEPALRADVRIRNTVTLCTESLTVRANGRNVPILTLDQNLMGVGSVAMTEGTHLSDYCSEGRIKYEQ